jgi:ABC-2 type transport system permease protein
VLPSVMIVYFMLVPFSDVARSFPALVTDLGLMAVGIAAYGALFTMVGAWMKRPLVVGLVFIFGWEQFAMLMPGYLRRFTIAYYLQALVPHAMPADESVTSLLQSVFAENLPAPMSLLVLVAITVVSLILAMRIIERKEYVLEQ